MSDVPGLGTSSHDIALTVNGQPVVERVPSTASLADLLRDQLTLDRHQHRLRAGHVRRLHRAGRRPLDPGLPPPRRPGRRAARSARSKGWPADGQLNPLQQAFVDHHALQCGFCTPGFLMAGTEILEEPGQRPSRDELCQRLAGNVCRCTGYRPIVTALESVLGAPVLDRAEA